MFQSREKKSKSWMKFSYILLNKTKNRYYLFQFKDIEEKKERGEIKKKQQNDSIVIFQ